MTRLQFIKNLVGFLGLSQIPTEIGVEFEKIYLLQFFVRGFQYYEGPKLLKQINQSGLLDLKREPENKYDKNAIALYFEGHKIGFVPREENHLFAKMLDADLVKLQVEVTHIEPEAAAWEKIHAAIYALKEKSGDVPTYLTKIKNPHYYTLKTGKKYKRIYFEETTMMDGTAFYETLVQNSKTDRVYDLIHTSFENAYAMEEAVNNSRFVINKQNFSEKHFDKLIEKLDHQRISLDFLFENEGYYMAKLDQIALIPDKIEQFIKLTDLNGQVFYEVVLKI